jgi:hypothetical protein
VATHRRPDEDERHLAFLGGVSQLVLGAGQFFV